MKINNLFDKYTENISSIDDNTVIENTGVSYDNVRKRVFAEIKSRVPEHSQAVSYKENKTKPHKSRKKIIITLVAAAVLVAIICTTGYATGSFSEVFSHIFSGDSIGGYYSGGNVKVTAKGDDSLNFEVIGVTGGNGYEACIAYRVTKKDGGEFVDDTNNYTPGFSDWGGFSISTPIADTYKSDGWGGSFGEGYFEDTKTIIFYQSVNRDKTKIKGQHFNAEYKDLYINYIDENSEAHKFAEYKVTFNVSLDLDYKSYNAACIPDKTSLPYYMSEDESFDVNIGSTEVSQFSLTIHGNYGFVDTDKISVDNYLPSSGTVTMYNGDVYELKEDSNSKFSGNKKTEFINRYIFTNSDSEDKLCVIDFNEIKEIRLGDITFTVEK